MNTDCKDEDIEEEHEIKDKDGVEEEEAVYKDGDGKNADPPKKRKSVGRRRVLPTTVM